jgi:hypothetical protein
MPRLRMGIQIGVTRPDGIAGQCQIDTAASGRSNPVLCVQVARVDRRSTRPLWRQDGRELF